MHTLRFSFLLGAVFLSITLLAKSEEDGLYSGPSFALFVENDYSSGTDRYYTNGLRFAFLSSDKVASDLWPPLGSLSPLFDDSPGVANWGLSLTHQIFTPADRENPDPIPDDRPFAGWLALGLSFHYKTETRLDSLELSVGVLGPLAGAQEIQNFIHDAIGDIRLPGWDNQLDNEPTFDLTYRRQWLVSNTFGQSSWGWAGYGNAGFALGTTRVSANLGAGFRLGFHLPNTFSNETISSVAYDVARQGGLSSDLGFFVFADVRGDAVAFNSFLDGGFFRSGLSVDKEPLVAEITTGLTLTGQHWSLTASHVFQSNEFKNQESA